jgi:hypothetical protein
VHMYANWGASLYLCAYTPEICRLHVACASKGVVSDGGKLTTERPMAPANTTERSIPYLTST